MYVIFVCVNTKRREGEFFINQKRQKQAVAAALPYIY